MKKDFSIVGEFFMYVLPSIIVFAFIVICACGELQPEHHLLADGVDIIKALFDEQIVLAIIGFIPLVIPLSALWLAVALVVVPFELFCGNPLALGDWAMWFLGVACSWMTIGAIKLPLFGEFEEDSSYVSDTHWEITFDRDGNGTAKEVNEYSGGGEWFINAFRFLGRFFLIAFGGLIIFCVHLYKRYNTTSYDN